LAVIAAVVTPPPLEASNTALAWPPAVLALPAPPEATIAPAAKAAGRIDRDRALPVARRCRRWW
jgi:hypothetical protein